MRSQAERLTDPLAAESISQAFVVDQKMTVRFIQKLKKGIADRYQNESVSIRIKSGYLFYAIFFLSIILPLLLIGNLLDNADSPRLLVWFIGISSIFLFWAMAALYKGEYHPAATLTVLSMVCSLTGFIVLDDIVNKQIDFVHTLYLSFPVIFFQAVFGRANRFFILPLVFLLFAAACDHYLQYHFIPPLRKVMQGFQTDYIIAMLGIGVIGYGSIRIHRTIVRKLEERNAIIHAEMAERKLLEREMVQIDETIRRKIGHELHDDLGQILIGIDLRNKVLADSLKEKSGEDYLLARKNAQLIETMITKMRKLSRGMGLLDLDKESFCSALHNLASFTRENFDVGCQLFFEQGPEVADDLTAIQLYHIAQEAITNAIKHGKAGNIHIRLAATQNGIKLSIIDDGISFDGRSMQTLGSGLKIMAHRANLINGRLHIEKGNTQGTRVDCIIPVKVAD